MKKSLPCLNVCARAVAFLFLCACLLLAAVGPCQAVPLNNNLADAQVIPPGDSFSVSGTEVGATEEDFEKASDYPLHFVDAESGSAETVWYTWTPTVSGALTAHIGYPTFSPILGFFKAPTPDAASFVTASGIEMPTTGPADVVAGQPYLIVVSIPSGLASTFTIGATIAPSATLTPTPKPTPVNAPVATLSVRTPRVDRAAAKVGKVVVTLSSAPAGDLTLTYKIGGTAVNGADYKMLKGGVTVLAGQTSAEIKVKPLAGGSGTVNVKLSLTSGDGYTLGSPAVGKVKIVGAE